MTITLLWIHDTIQNLIKEAYLVESTSEFETKLKFGWVFVKAERVVAPLLGVVARDQKYTAKIGWSGRAPPRWSRTLQSLEFAGNRPNSPSLPLACNFSLSNAQWNFARREFTFIGSFKKKIDFRNPLYNVFILHSLLTLFWSSFCPEISSLRRLTSFFL